MWTVVARAIRGDLVRMQASEIGQAMTTGAVITTPAVATLLAARILELVSRKLLRARSDHSRGML